MSYEKRTSLIHQLSSGCKSKVLRGNTLWTLREENGECKIVCYAMIKEGEDWGYKEYHESSPPPLFSCPLKFLNQAMPLNEEWREQVLDYEKSRKDTKQQIRSTFRNLKKGERIQVTLQARPGYKLNVYRLIVLSVYPGIEGRGEDHKRYRIPFKLVKEIKVLPDPKLS